MDYVFVYLDDILMASNSEEEHKVHIQEVFKWFPQHHLVLHLEKCTFFASSMDFMVQHVSMLGLHPLGARVATIQAHPKPNTKSQLISCLGMLNFYKRYLKETASNLKPLMDATRRAGTKLVWTKEMRRAFLAINYQDSPHGGHPPGASSPGGIAFTMWWRPCSRGPPVESGSPSSSSEGS